MKTIFLFTIPLLACIQVNGQDPFANSGNLRIHTGGSLSGFGAFTNNATGTLVNNGGLHLKANISNSQASMTAGTGTLYLNGTAAQSLNGAQPFKTFNLISNNTAGMLLNNNLSVAGAHTYTSGVISTSATPNYLIYENGSSYSGDGDTRHLNGWVKKIGSANFIFPVGNGTIERTIALISLSVSSEFNVKYMPLTPFTTQKLSPVQAVNQNEYWTINKISGGTAAVTVNWNSPKVYYPHYILSDILVTGYDGTQWISHGGMGTASGSVLTTGTITSTSISSFDMITTGSQSVILPLAQLLSFTAKRPAHVTLLDWITAHEVNMKRFIAERSDDNSYFYTIAELPARNHISSEKYSARDDKSINGTAYYRLRYIDNDGKEKLSQVIPISDGNSNAQLLLKVNPVKDQIVLVATRRLNGAFDYSVTTVNGQIVQQGKLNIENGGQYTLPLNSTVTTGTYLLKVSNGIENFSFKLIVK